jgi:hypothetical protein
VDEWATPAGSARSGLICSVRTQHVIPDVNRRCGREGFLATVSNVTFG